MTIGYVVIGAGYGDEGKGLMTDYLVRKLQSDYVVRFNGGAQAGHTVQTSYGKRHVFGHVGAGTFAGAATILGPKFIINPLILDKEARALGEDFIKPRPFKDAPISTIYDMILNSAAELARGSNRHGSCGVGINETVTRHEHFPITLSMSSVGRMMQFKRIRDKYLFTRLAELGLTYEGLSEEMKMIIDIDPMILAETFNGLLAKYLGSTIWTDLDLENDRNVVFEGAQGLMLDEFLGEFPHVTRSMTGLPQAIHAASKLNIRELQPVYTTRCYATRHGAGPLPHEGKDFTTEWTNTDATNVDNRYQGSIRFAPLSIQRLKFMINADLQRSKDIAYLLGVKIADPVLAVTCLDQVHDALSVVTDNSCIQTQHSKNPESHAKWIANLVGLNLGYASFGPTAEDVRDAAAL